MLDRRHWLWHAGGGLGGIALSSLLDREARACAKPPGPMFEPKAKRVVQFFMAGAASHIDLFDYKPELEKRHGQPSDFGEKVETFQDGLGPWLKPVWKFKPYGGCGKLLAEPVSAFWDVVDRMAFIHNMTGKTGVHSQATYLQATGFQNPGFPGMGAWVSYGLGSLNDNLPTFVVLPDHRGYPSNGPKNWDSAFLPANHQGVVLRLHQDQPLDNLFPDQSAGFKPANEKANRELLLELDRRHAAARPGDGRLEARLRSYELAASLQSTAPEALDWRRETREVHRLYGLDHGKSTFEKEINPLEEIDAMGRKCLVARRLLERGVRFVQIWSGCDNGFPRRNWDSHEDILRDHGPLAMGMARGISALITDLARVGLLEDTIVLWTTEFGRMPSSQGGKGRDHNPHCFTNWMAGGGIKGGVSIGPSDDFGFKPANRQGTQVYDVHATILHQLGLDHTALTVRHNGADRRLTDVHGHILQDLLA